MSKLFLLLFAASLAAGSFCARATVLPQNSGQSSQTTPPKSSGDIPQQKPGTNNPDVAPDAKPAVNSTNAKSKSKKRKHKETSSTHTAPTA